MSKKTTDQKTERRTTAKGTVDLLETELDIVKGGVNVLSSPGTGHSTKVDVMGVTFKPRVDKSNPV